MTTDSPGRRPARWALAGERVLTPAGVRPAAVLVENGRIAAVLPAGEVPAGVPVADAGRRAVLPGLIDSFARAGACGFDAATRSAAAAGITTVVDVPCGGPPAESVTGLGDRRDAAAGRLWVDCGFLGAAVPGNPADLPALAKAGVLGFVAALCRADGEDFPASSERDLRLTVPAVAATGLPLVARAELPGPVMDDLAEVAGRRPEHYRAFLAARPAEWELEGVRLLMALCAATRCRVHLAQVSAARSLQLVRRAKDRRLPFTAQTCPHYLGFAAEEIKDGAVEFKASPPVRRRHDREMLWEGLREGVIDTVASDHAPPRGGASGGRFAAAPAGVAGLAVMPASVWMTAWQKGVSLAQAAGWMSARPAELFGLAGRKGAITPGADADLVVFDSESFWTVDAAKAGLPDPSPWQGRRVRGVVEQTYLRGRLVYDRGEFVGEPAGQVVGSSARAG